MQKESDIMTTKLINLCPHTIDVLDECGFPALTVAPSGTVARVSQREEVVDFPDLDLPCRVTRQVFGEVVDLPEATQGVCFIVSRLVAAACPERKDLFIPGPLVRDESGNPVGCHGLSTL